MAPLPEIIKSLYGAYRLGRFSLDGMSYFNISASGFFRSFSAAAVVAPFFLILLLVRFAGMEEPPAFGRYLILEVLSFVIAWCVFPLVMEGLSRSMDRSDKYVPFIIAYNWSMVPQNVIYIVVILCGHIGIFSDGTTNGLALIVLIWSLAFTGFIARTALGVSPITAGGVVFMDLLLSICIEMSIGSMS